MHNMEFGQAYCKDFLKRNPKKFILYFLIFYQFKRILEVNWISEYLGNNENSKILEQA
jgi:uncharacterized protein YpiB (UPF0302 family)